ncbi:hypothetical protein [Thermoflexibacter ruber]|uniref:Uncharacterized protein n=1 Tax=Thermoflexibacter ruber TaxID=1003 RepID=A0A1I2DNS4_9BACT|nr:hypothetical protein [Thermoflexibacter ruber]SFE82185.1 hypothetical protein SAMN04488541_1007103 [Thermoflexibacter ruber]
MGKKTSKKEVRYSEAELIALFGLDKTKIATPLMQEWLMSQTTLLDYEQKLFDSILHHALENIEAWSEEDLKMNFIAFVLELSHLKSSKHIRTFFDKTIEAEIEGHFLKVKSDFMIAKGILDLVQKPYFHFQEYKKERDPHGDPLAQLIEAFLIAQAINQDDKPIYGGYVVGRFWNFVIIEGKQYCVSEAYDSTKQKELMQIIAILRKFREILETRLLD